MKFLSYPEYRDTGVEWFSRIPAHWQCKKIKFSFKNKGAAIKTGPFGSQLKSEDMKGTDIKIYNQKSVIQGDLSLGDEYINFEKFNELSAFEVFEEDLLITTRGTIGRCKLVENGFERGILHPCLMRIQLESDKFNHKFFIYLLQESGLLLIELMLKSNATTLDVIYSETLKNLVSPVPPIKEQNQIAEFLDHKTAQIDRLIEKKKALIEKLNEKRIALITQVVTKGLNPDAPMKPSDVDWLGDVPSHWVIKRLKFSVDIINNKIEAKSADLPYLGMENIESFTAKKIYDEDNPPISDGVGSHYKLGHILFGKLRPYLAKAYLAEEEGFCSTEILVLQAIEFIPEYLTYFVLSDGFIKQVNSSAYGSKMPRASWDYIGSLPALIPPPEEQAQLVDFLKKKTKEIDGLIQVNNQTIERLAEYRTALITAAVTGKIDVRNIEIPAQEAA